ncbi:hypothetical protein [Eubacterium oxidoreducens]|uniref:Oxaloacetate decarboxylase, gamma chain n=1 Tax=Eubacterium oxidoreducens TaxID=1732 RepID=A0A1G6CDJ3_EUBOX|nr:hypothetical protein [Eubacterium oxidoreducens]SDB30974.1 hypothetical protein SAMN02910417_02295 [Eubacterium oxidoreducens]
MNDLFRNILITVILVAIVALIGLGIWKMLVKYAKEHHTMDENTSTDEETEGAVSDVSMIDFGTCVAMIEE